MNPCPCGHLYDGSGKCKCSSSAILKYRSKISGPVMDRIDIHVLVRPVKANELIFPSQSQEETSSVIAERVKKARDIQMERYKNNKEDFFTNAAIPPSKIAVYCKLKYEDKMILEAIVQKYGLSARGYSRVLKIARTIADLEGLPAINGTHLAEASNLRCSEKNEMIQ